MIQDPAKVDDGRKKKTLADLLASKKKKKPTVVKIGEEAPVEEAKPDVDSEWKEEDDKKEEDGVNPFLTGFGLRDLDAEKAKAAEEERSRLQGGGSKSWNMRAVKAKEVAAPKAGPPRKVYAAPGSGRYGGGDPGQVSDHKYPQLGKGLIKTGTQVGKADEKASAARGLFAALDNDSDDDDAPKRAKMVHAHQLKKAKGANEGQTLTAALRKEGVTEEKETEEEKKARMEREEKKQRQKDLARVKREEIVAQMKAKPDAAPDKSRKVEYQADLFTYTGRLDFEAQREKYQERERLEWKDIPALVGQA